jgi:hypothetical protein
MPTGHQSFLCKDTHPSRRRAGRRSISPMTNLLEEPTAPVSDPAPRLPWEVPELVGVGVLLVVALFALGGLATGVAASLKSQLPDNISPVWTDLAFGAQWAEPLIALLVLGVLGVCWWQLQAWAEVIEAPDEEDENDRIQALGHMVRARIGVITSLGALGVTALGSVAGFVGSVGQGPVSQLWPEDVFRGTEMLAVLVVLAIGMLIERGLRGRYGVLTA